MELRLGRGLRTEAQGQKCASFFLEVLVGGLVDRQG